MIGRWTSVDPSADDGGQESDTPYGYVANNPISRTDPDGKVWNLVVGAAIGAAVDIALQSADIALSDNKSFSKDFSYKSVAVSAIAGATGVGLASKIGKLGTVARIGIELAHDAVASAANQYATEGRVDVKSTVMNAVGGKVAGDIAGKVIRKNVANSPQAKYLANQANRASRVAGNSPGRATRAAAAVAAAKKAENYGNTRAVAAATASSGVAGKVISKVEEDKKKK